MQSRHHSLTAIVLLTTLSVACEDDVLSVTHTAEEDGSPTEDPASAADDPSGESTPDGVMTESDPLRPDPDGEAPPPSDGAGEQDTGAAGTSGGDPPDSSSPDSTAPGAGSDAGGTSGDPPVTNPPLPLPDLVLDAEYLEATIQQAVVDASVDSCLINEQCITGMGLRRVVRFGTRSGNIGTADLVAGRPSLDNPVWEYDACHDHFHFEGYAAYELIDATTSSVLPVGVKHGFCLRDLGSWDGSVPSERCSLYDCDYQGLGVGCYDVYVPELDCQWVDITDVAPGEYDLRVTINSEQRIQELDRSNNSATVRILITPDTVQVVR